MQSPTLLYQQWPLIKMINILGVWKEVTRWRKGPGHWGHWIAPSRCQSVPTEGKMDQTPRAWTLNIATSFSFHWMTVVVCFINGCVQLRESVKPLDHFIFVLHGSYWIYNSDSTWHALINMVFRKSCAICSALWQFSAYNGSSI